MNPMIHFRIEWFLFIQKVEDGRLIFLLFRLRQASWEKCLDGPGKFTEPALTGLGVQRRALRALGRYQEREQGVLGNLVSQPHRAHMEGEEVGLSTGPMLMLHLNNKKKIKQIRRTKTLLTLTFWNSNSNRGLVSCPVLHLVNWITACLRSIDTWLKRTSLWDTPNTSCSSFMASWRNSSSSGRASVSLPSVALASVLYQPPQSGNHLCRVGEVTSSPE